MDLLSYLSDALMLHDKQQSSLPTVSPQMRLNIWIKLLKTLENGNMGNKTVSIYNYQLLTKMVYISAMYSSSRIVVET
jgi:hypothetical protein